MKDQSAFTFFCSMMAVAIVAIGIIIALDAHDNPMAQCLSKHSLTTCAYSLK